MSTPGGCCCAAASGTSWVSTTYRDEQRTFRVDRFDGGADGVDVGTPGSFERPATFDPRSAFPADPKQIGQGLDDSVDATVLIDAVRSRAAVRELGEDRVVARHADGSVELLVPASNLDAFRSWLLGMLQHAVVLGPPDVRAHVVEWLTLGRRRRFVHDGR